MRALVIGLCLLMVSTPAFALKCKPNSVDRAFVENHHLVFKGKANISKQGALLSSLSKDKPVEFTVQKAWKGTKVGEKLNIYYQQKGGAGTPYRDGESYVVFAAKDGDKFTVSPCEDEYVEWPKGSSPEATLDRLIKPEEAPVTIPKNTKAPFVHNAKGEPVVPAWCEAWFDGCNNCARMEEGAMCTQRGCEKTEDAYCLKVKESAAQ